MVRSMLVGVSGSRYSKAAVGHAIELAKKHQATLLGLGIVDVPHLCPPEPVPLGAGAFKQERDEAVLKEAHEQIGQLLSEFTQHCATAHVTCRTMKLEGDPADILVAEAQRVDFVVVGKKRLPEGEWEPASQTLATILHHTPRPVICVPESPAVGGPALIAFDGSLQAAKALQLFVASGLAAGRDLHLLTVADDGAAWAHRGVEFLQSHGLAVHAHVEPGNDAAKHILEKAGGLGAGLIVMGAYGKPRLREFIFGSVTRSILRDTKVPLFLYH